MCGLLTYRRDERKLDRHRENGDDAGQHKEVCEEKALLQHVGVFVRLGPATKPVANFATAGKTTRSGNEATGRAGGIAQLVEHYAGSVRVRSSSLLASKFFQIRKAAHRARSSALLAPRVNELLQRVFCPGPW